MALVGRDLARSHIKIADRTVEPQRVFVWEKPHSALFLSQPSREVLLLIHLEWYFLLLSLFFICYMLLCVCVCVRVPVSLPICLTYFLS